jgi:hypothetical protein
LTFITDLDNLIKEHHGDVKKLREIRDTIKHDNFITTVDKNYVESLITTYLKNQPLEKPLHRKQPDKKQADIKSKLQQKPTVESSYPKTNSAFSFSSNKKFSILGGAAAAIAIIAVLGFTSINQDSTIDSVLSSTPNNPLLITVDQNKYQRADIISISGDTGSSNDMITLSIEDTNGIKIWNENIKPKSDGNFSTLVIAGGGGWENNGAYTLKAVTKDTSGDSLQAEIKFQFVV